MSCWSVLGISHEADARTIKRHYAALLKRYRPDEDPEGFQRLREAYEQALNWAKARQDTVDSSANSVSLLVALPLTPNASPTPAGQPAEQLAKAQQDDTADRASLLVPFPEFTPNAGPTPAWQLAERLADGLDAESFADRLEQAQRYACVGEFEDIVLQRCQAFAMANVVLTEQATQRFQWLTPWQRDDLSPDALQCVLRNLKGYARLRMVEALRDADEQGCFDLCQHLGKQTWVQSLENTQWLHDCIAQVLIEADPWPDTLFEALSKYLGWKQTGTAQRCGELFWNQLLARSHRNIFLAEQRRIANQGSDSSARRAARLLFTPLTDDERVKLTAHFTNEDWHHCEKLCDTVRQRHPELFAELPALRHEVWRPLRRKLAITPIVLAVSTSAILKGYQDYYRLGANLYDTFLVVALIVVVLGLCGWLLTMFCRSLGCTYWRFDKTLQERFGHWLSLRRPPPLPIRESLPFWLLAGVFYEIQGLAAFIAYSATLTLLALASRTDHLTRALRWLVGAPHSAQREVGLGVAIGMALSLVFVLAASANYRPLPVNQGLQAWPERFCASAGKGLAQCRSPSWYPEGTETTP